MGLQWEELTPKEQDQAQDLVNSQRALEILLGQTATLAMAIVAAWNGGTSSLFTDLDPTASVPNTSAYAGAQAVSPNDVAQTMVQAMAFCDPTRSVLGTDETGGGYNTDAVRQLRVKFCGINASL